MYQLIETIKIIDGIPQNISWHQKRLEASYYELFRTKTKIELDILLSIPNKFKTGIVKLRFLYGKEYYVCEYSHYKPKKLRKLKLIFDNEINYSLKLINRFNLQLLLELKADCDDILIVKNGFITDSSYTNIVFYDGLNWVTPNTPLLQGTSRTRLIEEGLISEKTIKPIHFKNFISFKLINAMLDFESQEELSIENLLM